METNGCLFCGAPLKHPFLDLGMHPLCESYVSEEQLDNMEPFFPLTVYVCAACFLVQLHEYVRPAEIFAEYAYFSSYADSWVQHARLYTDMIVERLRLNQRSLVVELGSNDGYLLQHFVAKRIPVLGVEPAGNVAEAARKKDIPTLVRFFGEDAAREVVARQGQADLVVGNNVLAQGPAINDFVGGVRVLLAPAGTVTMEFPHLMRLMEGNQFDTIYHEHFFYFSLTSVEKVFAAHGLTLFDVEELSTHGGSLRIYGRHVQDETRPVTERYEELMRREKQAGVDRLEFYEAFEGKVKETKWAFLEFLIQAKKRGKHIAGYGAPGKGNTLLNYCGVRGDFIDYTVDKNTYKQGKYLPGTHIPIYAPSKIKETRPDYVLILPWNLKDEIMDQMGFIREWGGQFIVPIPEVRIY